jgi:hypothetical protein
MLYLDTDGQWEMLSDEQAGKLIKALFKYVKTGEALETDDGMLKMAFSFISGQYNRDSERYEAKCEKNRQIALEREKKKREERIRNSTNVHEREQTYTNSTDIDKDKDKDKDKDINNNKRKAHCVVSVIDSMLSEYTENASLIATIKDFAKFRKQIKAPLTERALKLCLNKLDELADTDERKIKVVEQSIERGWKGLFPLKEEPKEEKKDGFDASKYEFLINNI